MARDDDARFWVFTFGYGHTHPVTGESLADKAIRFEGDYRHAREQMCARFGIKWAFQYASAPGPVGVIEPAVAVANAEGQ